MPKYNYNNKKNTLHENSIKPNPNVEKVDLDAIQQQINEGKDKNK